MNMMQMARSVVGRMFGRPQWMLPGFPTGFMFPMMGPMMGPRPFNAVKTVSEGPLTKFWKSLVKKVQKRIARWKIRMGSFGLRKPSKTNLEPQKSSKTLPAPENNGDITDIENKIDEPQTIADSNEKLSSKKPAQKPAKKAVSLAAVVGEEVAPVQGMRLRGDEIVEVDRILAPSHSGGPFPRRVKGVRKGMV
ncbi:hypothetical protein BC829DRAFT_401630 [Chytridium lagenaria]|nr:hypothetical protein BC829DRAFT_401630 [Chytridium lagenaria]